MTNKTITTTELGREFGMTAPQLSVIINSIAKGATVDELRYFMLVAKKTGLDPLSKQIHFVKRKSRNLDGSYTEVASIQTGIDGYRAIAERTGTLAGIDDVLYDTEDAQHPNKATVTVHRMVAGQRIPFTASARWNEYAQTKKDYKTNQISTTGLWAKMPFLMLGKCAEALALRKAFPNDLSGIYTNEEMQEADNELKTTPEQPSQSQTIAPKPTVEKTTTYKRVVDDPRETGEATDGEFEPCEVEKKENNTPPLPLCQETGVAISEAEYDYSMRHFGRPLSREAQKTAKPINK